MATKVVIDDFETDYRPFKLTGNYTLTTSAAASGTRSMQIKTGHATSNSVTLTFYLHEAFDMSFNYRVSSEDRYDYLTVTVDGVQKIRIAGNGQWLKYTQSLGVGNHTVVFNYSKDGSGSSNLDAAFIDNITLPALSAEGMDKPSLVFLDDAGRLYNNTRGDVLQPLKIETLTAGQTSAVRKLTLMSACPFPVNSVQVFIKPFEFPANSEVELSMLSTPFIPENSNVFNGVTLTFGEAVDFYFRLVSHENTPSGGDYYIYAKAVPVT